MARVTPFISCAFDAAQPTKTAAADIAKRNRTNIPSFLSG
jgi:hypothetical protein